MRTGNLAKTTAMLAALLAPAGCAAIGSVPDKNLVSVLDGPYEDTKSTDLPNDIKDILSAGGLDVTDPSAPVSGTKVAELATGTPKEVVDLVAKLDDGEAKVAKDVSVPTATARRDAEPALLSLAAPQKESKAETKVVEIPEPGISSVTFVYPEIVAGASAETAPAKDEKKNPSIAAQERKRASGKGERIGKPAEVAATAAEKPRKVRRF